MKHRWDLIFGYMPTLYYFNRSTYIRTLHSNPAVFDVRLGLGIIFHRSPSPQHKSVATPELKCCFQFESNMYRSPKTRIRGLGILLPQVQYYFQTWEDPSLANHEVEGAFGDNDPVDVVEIGEIRGKIGQILKIKPLAALAMIDEGELDWKIVAISLDDLKASLVNDVDDVEIHFSGTLTVIRVWFRDYKIPDGKPANKFSLGNKAANKVVLSSSPAIYGEFANLACCKYRDESFRACFGARAKASKPNLPGSGNQWGFRHSFELKKPGDWGSMPIRK